MLIAHDYPPRISARAIRWSAVAEYWAQRGNRLDVISAWQSDLPQEEWIRGVHVHRVNALWLERLRGWFKKRRASAPDPPTGGSDEPSPRTENRRITRLASWAYHSVYKQLYWPDSAFPWYRSSVNQARRLLSQDRYDAILTVSPYFTAHLIGMRIHKEFPQTRWLVDIGDPFSYLEFEHPNNRRLYNALNYRSEQRVFRHAHAVTVTTKETLNRYAVLFPDCATKLHVIPPLLSKSASEDNPPPIFPEDRKVRLMYVGRLYRDVRSPDFLLRLFTALLDTALGDRLELHFIGDTREVGASFVSYSSLIGKKILLHGTISHGMAEQMMREANILVNIGNKTSYQLPSKVVEYANTGRPILNLAQIEKDSSAAFFETYPAVLNLLDSKEADFNQHVKDLNKFINEPPSEIDRGVMEQWLSQFQVEAISAKYERILFNHGE